MPVPHQSASLKQTGPFFKPPQYQGLWKEPKQVLLYWHPSIQRIWEWKYTSNISRDPDFTILGITDTVETRILSFVIIDLTIRRLAEIKRDTFEDLLCTTGIPCLLYYRRSYAIWDILLPTEEYVAKLVEKNLLTRIYYRLQPWYKKSKGDSLQHTHRLVVWCYSGIS